MKCKTCPRMLTQYEQSRDFETCDVCRGVRRDSKSQSMVISPPKPPSSAGESWWTQLTSKELNAESRRRFTR